MRHNGERNMDKACIKLIADQLAAEVSARAAILRAQHKLRGRRLSYRASINAALAAMANDNA
jgi:predicted component of type VI protein secretion system